MLGIRHFAAMAWRFDVMVALGDTQTRFEPLSRCAERSETSPEVSEKLSFLELGGGVWASGKCTCKGIAFR